MVSVLDSGAEGPWVQITVATLSSNSLRETVHTHCASVHQAAQLVAALYSHTIGPTYTTSSTNLANVSPVDVEMIGLTESLK